MDRDDQTDRPSRSHPKWPWVAAAAIVGAIGFAAGIARLWRDGAPGAVTAGPVDSPLVGRPAPNFVLPDLDDSTRRVSLEEFRGQPVVVNFWASWCGPCRREMPALKALHQQFSGCVAFVGVDHADDAGSTLTARLPPSMGCSGCPRP